MYVAGDNVSGKRGQDFWGGREGGGGRGYLVGM